MRTARARATEVLCDLPCPGGTYVLVLACPRTQPVRVGRLGTLRLRPGFYLYVGSACGSGGLRARLRHHFSPVQRFHWHCDYLRPACVPVAVWFSVGRRRLEHVWARRLAGCKQATVPLPGFGASDCSCVAHLFLVGTPAALLRVRQHLASATPGRLYSLNRLGPSDGC